MEENNNNNCVVDQVWYAGNTTFSGGLGWYYYPVQLCGGYFANF